MKATGIDNLGNTCYLNSALQALFFTPSLTNTIIHNKDQFMNVDKQVFIEYCNIVKELFNKQSPNKTLMRDFMDSFLKEHPHFQSMRKHHDSHETLLSIIDSLDEAIKPFNHIQQIFDTKVKQKVSCSSCNHIVETKVNIRNYSLNHTDTSVQEGLYTQLKEEDLDGYKCDECKKETCKRSHIIIETPHILIININMYDMFGRKQSHKLKIDETIRMGKREYILYATLCHHGHSQFGHYTANCISKGTKYFIDDETVTENDKNFTFNAYTLLYKLSA